MLDELATSGHISDKVQVVSILQGAVQPQSEWTMHGFQ